MLLYIIYFDTSSGMLWAQIMLKVDKPNFGQNIVYYFFFFFFYSDRNSASVASHCFFQTSCIAGPTFNTFQLLTEPNLLLEVLSALLIFEMSNKTPADVQ